MKLNGNMKKQTIEFEELKWQKTKEGYWDRDYYMIVQNKASGKFSLIIKELLPESIKLWYKDIETAKTVAALIQRGMR